MYRLLIADDEKDERDVIQFLLNKYGFEFDVLQASNGKEAVNILMEEQVDILITDIKMPFLNGTEVAAKAKTINQDIEILFFSGYDDFEYVKTALSLHAVNYILKPVNPEEFKKSIGEILDTIIAREAARTESEKYIKEYFFSKSKNMNNAGLSYEDKVSDEEDNLLLKNIEQAIKEKNPEGLAKNVNLLLEKYKGSLKASHIYVRYLCTTLLSILIDALPGAGKEDFKQAAEEVYSYKHFSHIRKLIEEYLNKVMDQMKEEENSPKHAIHLVKQYIHAHYKEDLSLNLLADTVFLSPKYLSSAFIHATGISLNKYIKNVRMDRAKDLLLTTNMKIKDIGPSVGYYNVSYFCKCFQEEFGLTPDKYRQNRGKIQ